jgi:hypothetical protein
MGAQDTGQSADVGQLLRAATSAFGDLQAKIESLAKAYPGGKEAQQVGDLLKRWMMRVTLDLSKQRREPEAA